jgi:hypothetical protein
MPWPQFANPSAGSRPSWLLRHLRYESVSIQVCFAHKLPGENRHQANQDTDNNQSPVAHI